MNLLKCKYIILLNKKINGEKVKTIIIKKYKNKISEKNKDHNY